MKRNVIVDSLLINEYQTCALKFKYFKLDGLRPQTKDAALEKGDLLHRMLECYYKHLKALQRNFPQVFMELDEESGEVKEATYKPSTYELIVRTSVERARIAASSMTIESESVETTINTFEEYTKFYRGENWQVEEVEKIFAFTLFESEEIKIIASGKIDLIVNSQSGKLVVDHKSTSKNPSHESIMSNQFAMYCLACDVQNVVKNRVGFQKTLPPNQKFTRPVLSYSKSWLEWWHLNTIESVLEMVRDVDNKHFPANLTSCDKYSGCIYRRICEATPDAREFIKDRDYVFGKEWDVSRILEATIK